MLKSDQVNIWKHSGSVCKLIKHPTAKWHRINMFFNWISIVMWFVAAHVVVAQGADSSSSMTRDLYIRSRWRVFVTNQIDSRHLTICTLGDVTPRQVQEDVEVVTYIHCPIAQNMTIHVGSELSNGGPDFVSSHRSKIEGRARLLWLMRQNSKHNLFTNLW